MPSITTPEARKMISNFIVNNSERIEHNENIFRILEGEIKSQVEAKLIRDLGRTSASKVIERQAPINYYRKVIDKLTNIYNQGVTRTVVNGTEADQDLVVWYENTLNMNQKMNANNELYNSYRYSLLHITLDDPDALTGSTKPFIRTIPNHQFLVMNLSKVDPTSPDVIIVFMGKDTSPRGEDRDIFFVYTDTEFMIIDLEGNIAVDLMDALGQDFENEFRTTPFVYTNGSDNLVMPLIQSDDLDMALLIPLLLTDLNYAVKFQAFSIFVAIDVDDQKIELSPDSILSLKSDPEGEKPSFDTIKPTVDITETLELASSEISLWLTSKGIRPGMISTRSDTFSSGISKMIDDADTLESREKQIVEYKVTERKFWNKLLKVFHPVWVAQGLVENTTLFTSTAEVVTEFPQPKPLQTRMDVLNELKAAIEMDIESRRGALKTLNPELDDDAIDEKLAEIDAENTFNQLFEVPNEQEEVEEEAV